MNKSFVGVALVAVTVFIFGAVVLPDDTFIRLLAFWSLAMSAQLVRATWRLGFTAARGRIPSQLGTFALGLLLVNVSLILQRIFGFAVRDFGMNGLLHSDLFSAIVAAMIAGQALKYAAIDANGGGVVNCKVATISILRSLAIGTALFLAYLTALRFA